MLLFRSPPDIKTSKPWLRSRTVGLPAEIFRSLSKMTDFFQVPAPLRVSKRGRSISRKAASLGPIRFGRAIALEPTLKQFHGDKLGN